MKDAGNYSKKIVDDLLDQITSGDHSKTVYQLKQVCPWCPEMSQVHQDWNSSVALMLCEMLCFPLSVEVVWAWLLAQPCGEPG